MCDTCHKIRTTPGSDCRGLAYLLPLDELLRFWEPQEWIQRTILGIAYIWGRPLIITPTPYIYIMGVNERTTLSGVIFSGSKRTYL